MKKEISLRAALLLVLAAVLITFSLTLAAGCIQKDPADDLTQPADTTEDAAPPSDALFDEEKLREVIERFLAASVGEFDRNGITDALLKGFILETNDDYASYMTAEEYTAHNQSYVAGYVGIGITVTLNAAGAVEVLDVTPDSPAEEAGFLVGDLLTAVDGISLEEAGDSSLLDRASALIRGEEGTKVTVGVLRGGKTLTLTAERRAVEKRSVRYTLCEYNGQKAAYLMITGFDLATPVQFKEAVDDAEQKGADFFIFDVRNNPGGLLSSVAAVLTYILPDDTLLATTEYRDSTSAVYTGGYVRDAYFENNGYSNETPQLLVTDNGVISYNSAYAEHVIDRPMAVLINGGSASAAELFTAALRDYEVAIPVGENSYGKGCMQITYPFSDGTALKVTVAYYTPPCGVNYDKMTDGPVGIAPAVEVIFTEEESRRNLYTLDHREDRQFVAAFNALTTGEKLEAKTGG